ncbi:MAG: CotH kinase family protein [Fluviicola sp.]|nr:CotH kinase family protein [Fluviicola sp.]
MKKLLLILLLASFQIHSQTLTDSNLPIVVITTPVGQSIQDDPRIICNMGIIDNGFNVRNYLTDPFTNYDGRIEIEIRGSTSQQYPKKGYGFETQDSLGANLQVAILGMPPENDWILNGPYPDKTMIRNALTFDLAIKMGHYASDYRFCELVIDGDYRGVYIMMERIKQDLNRVNIAELSVPNLWSDTLTGGYIVKVDKLTGEVGYSWISNYDNEVIFQFHDPEFDEMNSLQASYMENAIVEFEDAINGPDFADPNLGYPSLIETQSFYDFFILQELGRTVDGYRSSSFLHKDKDGFAWNAKLVAGPMWDFNLSYGNADYCDADLTTGWQYNFNNVCNFSTSIPFWWGKLLQSPTYANGLQCRWQELRAGPLSTANMQNFIDSVANYIQEGRIRNFQRWPIIGQYVNWNGFVGQTYQEDLDYLKTYVANRANWIDNNLPGICDLSVSENEFEAEYHKIWPNPTSGKLNLGISLFQQGKVAFVVHDMTGKVVAKKNLGEYNIGTHAFDLGDLNLKSGSYVYSVLVNNELIYSGKLMRF